MLTRRFLREFSAQHIPKPKERRKHLQITRRKDAIKKEIRQKESSLTWCEFIINNHKIYNHEMDKLSTSGELSINVSFLKLNST